MCHSPNVESMQAQNESKERHIKKITVDVIIKQPEGPIINVTICYQFLKHSNPNITHPIYERTCD